MSEISLPIIKEITRDQLPKGFSKSISTKKLEEINKRFQEIAEFPEELENLQNNFLNFTSVLKNQRFSITSYVNACLYVGLQAAGFTNYDAYKRVFPDRYEKYIKKYGNEKYLETYIHAYNSSKLVNLIKEQQLIPFYLINQHHRQEGLNILLDIARNSKNDNARQRAASDIVAILAPPEALNVNVNVEHKLIDEARAIKDAIEQSAKEQKIAVENGSLPINKVLEGKVITYHEDS